MSDTSIKQMLINMMDVASTPVGIVEGYVKVVSPLKVGLTNDKKMNLSDDDMIVSSQMKSSIKKGAKLYLLVVNDGKQFYVLGTV